MHISRQMIALYLELEVGFQCWKAKYLNLLSSRNQSQLQDWSLPFTVHSRIYKSTKISYFSLINTFIWHFFPFFPVFIFKEPFMKKKKALKEILKEQIEPFNKYGDYISPFRMLRGFKWFKSLFPHLFPRTWPSTEAPYILATMANLF